MQRFKAKLTHPYNTESLVRDPSGEYVKYEDAKRLEDKVKELAVALAGKEEVLKVLENDVAFYKRYQDEKYERQ